MSSPVRGLTVGVTAVLRRRTSVTWPLELDAAPLAGQASRAHVTSITSSPWIPAASEATCALRAGRCALRAGRGPITCRAARAIVAGGLSSVWPGPVSSETLLCGVALGATSAGGDRAEEVADPFPPERQEHCSGTPRTLD